MDKENNKNGESPVQSGNSAKTVPERKQGGLYRNVKMSVKTANILVIVCVAALFAAMIFLVNHNGFTVNFDTNGGSQIESCRLMHGDKIPDIDPPTKEGYEFTGWYYDRECSAPWDMEKDVVTDSFTLYAGWREVQQE